MTTDSKQTTARISYVERERAEYLRIVSTFRAHIEAGDDPLDAANACLPQHMTFGLLNAWLDELDAEDAANVADLAADSSAADTLTSAQGVPMPRHAGWGNGTGSVAANAKARRN